MSHLGDLAAALADGELGHETRDLALAHLAGCAACRAETEAERTTKRLLAGLGGPVPSAGLTTRLVGLALEEVRKAPFDQPAGHPGGDRRSGRNFPHRLLGPDVGGSPPSVGAPSPAPSVVRSHPVTVDVAAEAERAGGSRRVWRPRLTRSVTLGALSGFVIVLVGGAAAGGPVDEYAPMPAPDRYAMEPLSDAGALTPAAPVPAAPVPAAPVPAASSPAAPVPAASSPAASSPAASGPFASGPFASGPFASGPFAQSPVTSGGSVFQAAFSPVHPFLPGATDVPMFGLASFLGMTAR